MARLDPLQSARDFRNERHPRHRRRTNTRAQLTELQQQVLTNAFLINQPDQHTFVEILTALPEATPDDFTRFILVQLPGETLASSYVGTLGPDDVVFWQKLAGGIGAGGGTSPEFTFVANVASSLAIDGIYESSSFIYIARLSSSDQWRYSKSGGSTTLWESGGAAQAITFDNAGNFYLAQPANTRIRKFNPSGSLLLTTPTSKSYNSLYHRLGASHLFATSATNNEWYKIRTSDLVILNTVSTSINGPRGICEDSAGNIYVANTGANTIRKYNSILAFQTEWGAAGSGDGQFSTIKQMWVDDADRLYVADSGNDRVQVFDTSGVFLGKFGGSGSGTAQLDNPSSVHGVGTSICVADTGNNRVSRWDRT